MNKFIKFEEINGENIQQEYLMNVDSIEYIDLREKKVKDPHSQIRIRFGTLWIIKFVSIEKKFELPRYYGDKEREELFKRYFEFIKSDEFIFDIKKESDDICGDIIVRL